MRKQFCPSLLLLGIIAKYIHIHKQYKFIDIFRHFRHHYHPKATRLILVLLLLFFFFVFAEKINEPIGMGERKKGIQP